MQRLFRRAWSYAHELARVGKYLAIGAFVSVENILSVQLFTLWTALPYVVEVAIAQEISILISFALNDRVTFRALSANPRPWYVRCLRFHGVAVGGGALIVLLSTTGHTALGLPPLIAQCAAIALTTGLNFAMHRFWTYRGARAAAAPASLPVVAPAAITVREIHTRA